MPTGVNRRWLLRRRVTDTVTADHFQWAEVPVPTPAPGQFLTRNRWLSFDPTQLFMIAQGETSETPAGGIPVGDVMNCLGVGEVLESRHAGFSPGDLVHAHLGWEDYTVTDGQGFAPAFRVPADVPPNWAVGALGLTGLVAYFGVHEVARPRPGETFVISGAAGGVGSIASQLAKIEGLRVVAIAGSPAKCDWLSHEAGVDAVINYRQEDVAARLTELCPDGIDVFFDNDGGATLDLALDRLRSGGRVVLSGATSRYAAKVPLPGPASYLNLVMVNGRMEGLLGRDYLPRRAEAYDALLPLLCSGRLHAKEDVLLGLREAPTGLARLYAGENVGKQLLEMDAPSRA